MTEHRPTPNAQAILRKLVEMAGGPSERGYILALSGEGLDGVTDALQTTKGVYPVQRPQTELGLRRLIWKSNGAPFIALLSRELASDLPPDLIRRAHRHKVLSLSLTEILGLVLGVQVSGVDNEKVQRLALQHLDGIDRALRLRTLPTVVNGDLLDELVLEVTVGARMREASAAELLAGWLTVSVEWDEAVTDLVVRNLPALKGAEGRILAWALQHAERLRAIVVRGVLLAGEDDEVSATVWGPLAGARTNADVALFEPDLRRLVAKLALDTLDALGPAGESMLVEAEGLARQLFKPAELARNPLLPLGLANRCASVAQRASQGQVVPASDIAWIERHRAAVGRRPEIAVLVELARLARFVAREDVPVAGAPLAVWIDDYTHHGAFADRSAARLIRALAATAELHHEAQQVLTRYREVRNAANREFALRLAEGYPKALGNDAACPLHRLWHWKVLPQLQAGEHVYVVVLDGCSYTVFLELLGSLAQNPNWPVGVGTGAEGADEKPGLALLPSITSHSRGAIFLGEIPKDPLVAETLWRDEGERERDPGRFAQNKALAGRTRKLFLKGDLVDGGAALIGALRDKAIEVVATVFNAVDDQIGSKNTGATVTIAPEQIHAFVPSLKEAFRSGRKVLVTADHGHATFVSTSLKVPGKGAPRFVELAPGENAPDGYLEIDVNDLGGGIGRTAFAWEMGRYRGLPHVAYHGGCALEEMVVPMTWLVEQGSAANDPAWWFGGLHEASGGADAKPKKSAKKAEPKVEPVADSVVRTQFELFGAGAVAARAAKIGMVGLSDPIVASLTEDERAALVVLAQNGSARATELGQAIGRAASRMAGYMTKLRRKLHEAGVVRFRIEVSPGGESQFVYLHDGGDA